MYSKIQQHLQEQLKDIKDILDNIKNKHVSNKAEKLTTPTRGLLS